MFGVHHKMEQTVIFGSYHVYPLEYIIYLSFLVTSQSFHPHCILVQQFTTKISDRIPFDTKKQLVLFYISHFLDRFEETEGGRRICAFHLFWPLRKAESQESSQENCYDSQGIDHMLRHLGKSST